MGSGIHLPRRNFVGIGLGGMPAALTGIDLNASAERAAGTGKANQVLVIFEQAGNTNIKGGGAGAGCFGIQA